MEYGTVPAGGSTGLPFRRRTAIGSVAMLTLALAALVALTTLSSERSQSTILNQMQQLRNLEQQLMAANPSMTPLEAQQQAQLMEEGSITVDPNSENPAADFYANADDSDIGDEDVEDAGPGNHLGGWTHPELLDPPSPEEVQSFVDPANAYAAPVLSPADYARTPGAVYSMASAQRDIKHLQQAMAKAHEEAETAKATYEAEEAKSNKLKTQYAEYEENMKKMYAEGGGVGAHKWPLSESSTSSGNLMWSQNAKAPEHKNSNVDPSTWKVDTENMEDPAAEFRNNFYNKQQHEKAFLARMMQQQRRAALGEQSRGRMMREGAASPLMEQSGMMYQYPHGARGGMRSVDGQQLRMLDARAAAGDEEQRLAAADAAHEQVAQELQKLRVKSERTKLERDSIRLALARQRLAAASRAHRVRAAEGIEEYCPEGTPGCAASSPMLRMSPHLSRRALVRDIQAERALARMGDKMVPVQEARHQEPRLYFN